MHFFQRLLVLRWLVALSVVLVAVTTIIGIVFGFGWDDVLNVLWALALVALFVSILRGRIEREGEGDEPEGRNL